MSYNYKYPAIVGYTYNTSSKFYQEEVPTCLIEEINSIEFTSGTYYRGFHTSRLLGEIAGDVWKPKGICSASKDISIAKTFGVERFPSRVSVILIMGRTRDIEGISAHPREKEVLFYNQSFTIKYLGRKQDFDVWGAVEVGMKVKAASNPAKQYPFPTIEEVNSYVHVPKKLPYLGGESKVYQNYISPVSKYWHLSNPFSYYSFNKIDKLPDNFYEWYYKIGEDGLPLEAQEIGEVEIYYQKKKEVWVGYKWSQLKWDSIKYYYLKKDDKLLAFKVDWSDDKYCYLEEDVFIK